MSKWLSVKLETAALGELTLVLKVYKEFFNQIGLPTKISLRPPEDTFPGALKTYAFDTLVGSKVVQIGTVHYLGDNFSKVFNPSKNTYYGLCFGMSERIYGCLRAIYQKNLKYIHNPFQIVYLSENKKEKDSLGAYYRIKKYQNKYIEKALTKIEAVILERLNGELYNLDLKEVQSLEELTRYLQVKRDILRNHVFESFATNERLYIKPNIYGEELK